MAERLGRALQKLPLQFESGRDLKRQSGMVVFFYAWGELHYIHITKMNWNQIKTANDFDRLLSVSENSTVLIFKHSTRCSVSRFALKEFEQNWKALDEQIVVPFFLDLLEHRNFSDEIAARYNIKHESPQVLLIKNGVCFYSKTNEEIVHANIMSAAGRII